MLDEYVRKEHLSGWTYELRKTFLSILARCASRGTDEFELVRLHGDGLQLP